MARSWNNSSRDYVANTDPRSRSRMNPPLEYPGDYRGVPPMSYAPNDDDLPDPGEVVWTWVPYQEDYTLGKDRPVLIVGKEQDWLLGVMLTSQDHDIDREQENSEGRYWVEIGPGPWDASGRVSEVRVDRIIAVNPHSVRRIGGRLSQTAFDFVRIGISEHAADGWTLQDFNPKG